MPLYEEFDRYYAETQRGQKLVLHDPDETIQSKFPVADGEVILTQTRLYLATGSAERPIPNVRLERSRPQAFPEHGYLELAPRMGALLAKHQTGTQFLQMVDLYRRRALERVEASTLRARQGMRRRYDAILEKAAAHGATGEGRKMKDTLRSLAAAVPERREAAERLGGAYLEEGNARAAVIWLAAARAFDARFDRALGKVERPRLPTREHPPPELWIDRHLTPLLDLRGPEGPDDAQRVRIREARRRIADHRARSGRAGPLAWISFLLAVALWIVLLYRAPWLTLGVTTAAALAVGALAHRRARGRPRPRA